MQNFAQSFKEFNHNQNFYLHQFPLDHKLLIETLLKNGVDVMNSIRDFAHISHSEVRNCRAVMVMTSSVLGQIIFKIRPYDKWWSGQPLALIIIDL